MRGYIVDIFHGLFQGKSVIFAAGRLENGETFGLMDSVITPRFYIRASDVAATRPLLKKHQALLEGPHLKTMDGESTHPITAPTIQAVRALEKDLDSQGIRTYEADLDYPMLYRISRGISGFVDIEGSWETSQHVGRFYRNPRLTPVAGQADLTVLALDIETNADASRIFGFSLVSWQLLGTEQREEVHLIGEPHADDPVYMSAQPDEKSLLLKFQERLLAIDPDIVTGWNVIDFDLTVLAKLFAQHRLEFNLGRTKESSFGKQSKYYGHGKMVLRGRQVIDSLQLVRHSLASFEDMRLNTVAHELLGRGKTLETEEWQNAAEAIAAAYRDNRLAFCEYVLEDSRLVRDILGRKSLIELTVTRSQLTGLPLEKAWGSVTAFDTLYIRAMRQRAMVAPTLGIDASGISGGIGGLILEPSVGLHEHVLVFDFKSLYPSVMRTFNIDPIAFIEGKTISKRAGIQAPNGAVFSRDPALLPEILHGFFAHRAEAKRQGLAAESHCYKIIMNSFYGVLATDSCRFADRELADAITTFGQKLLLWMKGYFTQRGWPVLYGDTDSLFVSVPGLASLALDAILEFSQRLCAEANEALAQAIQDEYGVVSHMELEFDEYYRYLFLPADRGGEGSRAKNYAGLQIDPSGARLEIKGMEAVRSDWTPLAKNLQKDLLRMLFQRAAPREMEAAIRALIKSMLSGQRDEDLIYRKRIRKPLESYTKTTPPHIKAARLLPRTVRVVRYMMTDEGPQPLGFITGAVDYDHYIKKQILPIVEGLAPFAGFHADEACSVFTGFHFKEDFHA